MIGFHLCAHLCRHQLLLPLAVLVVPGLMQRTADRVKNAFYCMEATCGCLGQAVCNGIAYYVTCCLWVHFSCMHLSIVTMTVVPCLCLQALGVQHVLQHFLHGWRVCSCTDSWIVCCMQLMWLPWCCSSGSLDNSLALLTCMCVTVPSSSCTNCAVAVT